MAEAAAGALPAPPAQGRISIGAPAIWPASPPAALVLPSAAAGMLAPVCAEAQRRNIAVLVVDDVGIARAIGADGVHATSPAAFAAAQATLGRDAMIGMMCGASRHAAMEAAEAGAAYLAFGSDAADTLGWAAEVMQVPTVAWGFAHAAADFVAGDAE